MKLMQNGDGTTGLFGNGFQAWLPHVAANKFQNLIPLLVVQTEEPRQRFDLMFLADPKQALEVPINLVDQHQVNVTLRIICIK